jgi:hypothetical protein
MLGGLSVTDKGIANKVEVVDTNFFVQAWVGLYGMYVATGS